MTLSVEYFDAKFRKAPDASVLALNPFERMALPYLHATVLDFGCGLGNLSFAAAQQGCHVTALDGSAAAIAHIRTRAAKEVVTVVCDQADLRSYALAQGYDCVVSIGLLMFFDCATAHRVLSVLQASVRPGGIAVVNVLVQGTTFMDMFDPDSYCLFEPDALLARFQDWQVLESDASEFDAPGASKKCFVTVIARKPL